MIIATIYTDDEGFYGAEGSNKLDRDATEQNYRDELRKAILDDLPTVKVEFVWEPTMKVVEVIGTDDAEELEAEIGEIIANVYDRGEFWVAKEDGNVDRR